MEEGLRQGHQMWAGMRKSSSKAYLQDERIQFACLDLSSKSLLVSQLQEYKARMGNRGWDVVVHAAGATKCLHPSDFYRTNLDGTIHLVEALRETGMMPQRLVYLSSLSVFGAIVSNRCGSPRQRIPGYMLPSWILILHSPTPNMARASGRQSNGWQSKRMSLTPYSVPQECMALGKRIIS